MVFTLNVCVLKIGDYKYQRKAETQNIALTSNIAYVLTIKLKMFQCTMFGLNTQVSSVAEMTLCRGECATSMTESCSCDSCQMSGNQDNPDFSSQRYVYISCQQPLTCLSNSLSKNTFTNKKSLSQHFHVHAWVRPSMVDSFIYLKALITARQRSWGRVMFSQVSVCARVGG